MLCALALGAEPEIPFVDEVSPGAPSGNGRPATALPKKPVEVRVEPEPKPPEEPPAQVPQVPQVPPAPEVRPPLRPAQPRVTVTDSSPGPSPTAVSTSRIVSLQGGETLGAGGSLFAVAVGYSTFSAAYAQGFSRSSDLGGQLEFDWATSELFAGLLYRRLVARSDEASIALRFRGGFYADAGGKWMVTDHRSAAGIQFMPGVALSQRLADGMVSVVAEAPFDLTFAGSGGLGLGIRGAAAFEMPLGGDVTFGGRLGVGALWSQGSAPFEADSPRALLDLSLLVSYRFL